MSEKSGSGTGGSSSSSSHTSSSASDSEDPYPNDASALYLPAHWVLHSKLRVSRQQHQRKLFSLRKLGKTDTLDGKYFICKNKCLSETDALLHATFANKAIFDALSSAIEEQPYDSISASVDETITLANPFVQHFCGPLLDDTAPGEESPSRQAFLEWESSLPVCTRKRLRTEDTTSVAHSPAKVRSKTSQSASKGLVAQSMKSWEKYIESHLLSEGESVETFRSRKNNSGFIEKQQFQQKAEWNEFIQEASLQEKQRSLELSRATRRGEK